MAVHAAAAGEAGILGDDDRQLVADNAAPWSSVGRFNFGGYRDLGFCTGTLVRPDKVLTAAHCFFHTRTGKRLPDASFRFVLGLMRDSYLGLGRIKCVNIYKGYDPDHPERGRDAAIVVLDKPLNQPVMAISTSGSLAKGQVVSHAGYGSDRPYRLVLHKNCKVEVAEESLALTTCDAVHGQSGGPVLVEEEGQPKLAAIMSGIIEGKGSVVVTAAAWRDMIDGASCPQ